MFRDEHRSCNAWGVGGSGCASQGTERKESVPLVQPGGSEGQGDVLLGLVRGRMEAAQQSWVSAGKSVRARQGRLRAVRGRLRGRVAAFEKAARRGTPPPVDGA